MTKAKRKAAYDAAVARKAARPATARLQAASARYDDAVIAAYDCSTGDRIKAYLALAGLGVLALSVALFVASFVVAWVVEANNDGPKCPPGQEEVYDPPYATICV